MALDTFFLTVSLILLLCRFILLRNITTIPRQDYVPFVHFSGVSAKRSERKRRAENYLRRVIAVTGATQTGNRLCALNVGESWFQVHDQYVERLLDATDPDCRLEHTCFYLVRQDMPAAEKIATVLLQVKSNPKLFDGWFARSAAFKANGEVFRLIEKPPYG